MKNLKWILISVLISAGLTLGWSISALALALAEIAPTTLNLGKVLKGSSATATFSVKNTGNSLLSVSNISASDFQFSTFPTKFNLDPGKSQTVTVTFRPDVVGWERSFISISHNKLRRR